MLTAALYMYIGLVAVQLEGNTAPQGSGSGHWKIVENNSDMKHSTMMPSET